MDAGRNGRRAGAAALRILQGRSMSAISSNSDYISFIHPSRTIHLQEVNEVFESRLTDEARTVLSRYSSDKAALTLLPLWLQFEAFLLSRGTPPLSIHDIPEETLRAYATYLDYQDTHVDDALIALSAVLLVCLHAGCNARVLRSIVIPRIRRPVRNRQWEAFRLRTYKPLEYGERAHSRKRHIVRDVCAGEPARIEDSERK
jgi:hypothetical protein